MKWSRCMVAVRERVQTLQPSQLRRDLALSRERMARLVDVSSKTIARWEEQQALPANTRVRSQLGQLQEIRDLGLRVYTLEGFHLFLKTPLPIFGGKTALQMVEQGQGDEVIAALAADYEGVGY
jgi:DNA-binding XRE family transcriptional regulator